MGEDLERALNRPASRDFSLVELRDERTTQTTIEVRDGTVEGLSQVLQTGISARVVAGGAWGFASIDGSASPQRCIDWAGKTALSIDRSSGTGPIELADVRSVTKCIDVRSKKPLDTVDLSAKIDYLRTITTGVRASDDRITTCSATYTEVTGRRRLLTSDAVDVDAEVALVHMRSTAVGRSGSDLASARDEYGMVSVGWDTIEKSEPAEAITSRLALKIQNQMDGVKCRRGSFPCIMGPRAVGMLAHEALGHLSEADLFSQGAFVGMEGRTVAPSFVTLVDSPRLRGGFGNIEVDDEGVVPKPVTIIDRGILKDQMTNREWASKLGKPPTGNARSEGYRYPPVIRMRNTYFARGDMSLDELMEDVRNGYYCGDVRGGQAESNSSFQMGIQECFEIRKGELGRPVKFMAVSGVATKSIGLISGVGDDFGFESSYCGKDEQYMQTSDGGPHVSLRKGAIVFGGE